MFGRKIVDKLIILSIIVLAANLIFRLINQSQMIWNFPLDGTDWSTHLFELWAFDKYGFHGWVPNWYNGYELFKFYTPGWYFFTLPFYWIFKKVEIAGFLSTVALFIMGFVGIYLLGKLNRFSKIQITLFYLLFFGNALSVANFIRNGRVTELLAWVIFVFLAALLFYFKDKPLDFRFLACAPLFASLILAHTTEPITFGLLFLGFLLVKNWKERAYAIIAMTAGLLLSAFWWWPMLRDLKESYISELYYSTRLLNLTFLENLMILGVTFAFLVTFYFYLKSTQNPKKEFLFFSPILIFNILFLLKLTLYIPLLDRIYPHPAITFLSFFVLFFLFKTDWRKFKLHHFVLLLFTAVAVGGVLFNIVDTETFYVHSEAEKDAINLLRYVEGRYTVINSYEHVYPQGLAGYGPIYFNLNTSGGWMPTAISYEYYADGQRVKQQIRAEDCNAIVSLKAYNATDVIAFGSKCDYLAGCGLDMAYNGSTGCLYKL